MNSANGTAQQLPKHVFVLHKFSHWQRDLSTISGMLIASQDKRPTTATVDLTSPRYSKGHPVNYAWPELVSKRCKFIPCTKVQDFASASQLLDGTGDTKFGIYTAAHGHIAPDRLTSKLAEIHAGDDGYMGGEHVSTHTPAIMLRRTCSYD